MKKLLAIALLFSACGNNNSTPANEKSKSPIIGTPKKLGNIEIAENDFVEAMNWGAANTSCRLLGTGWRLPTKEELNEMYLNKDKIGGFIDASYWSSSKGEDYGGNYCSEHFNSGTLNKQDSYYLNRVRAVRSF